MPGQPDIQQHQFEAGAGQSRKAGLPAFHGFDGIAIVLEDAAQGLADAGLVIHHQDAPRLHTLRAAGRTGSDASASIRAGISIVKRAPMGGLSSTRMVALCSATMWLTIARPEAGAAVLGGKVGEEELLLVVRADAAAGIGHYQFNGLGGAGLGDDVELLDQGFLHGLGGVVHQVHDDALELLAVEIDGRKAGGEAGVNRNAVEAAVKDGEGLGDQFVQVAADRLRGGKAGELGELVDQRFDGFDGLGNGGGAFVENAVGRRRNVDAIDLARNALGGEGDGRQRILDFVRHAAGHFVPGGGLLRAQQFAGVLEHDDEAGGQLLFERGDRDGNLQLARGVAHFELAGGGAGAAGALHQVLDFRGVVAGKEVFEAGGPGDGFGRQDLGKRTVDALDRAVGGDGDHAGRNTFENRLGKAVAPVEFAAAGFESRGHLVEVAHEQGQFVHRAHVHAVGEIALAHLAARHAAAR